MFVSFFYVKNGFSTSNQIRLAKLLQFHFLCNVWVCKAWKKIFNPENFCLVIGSWPSDKVPKRRLLHFKTTLGLVKSSCMWLDRVWLKGVSYFVKQNFIYITIKSWLIPLHKIFPTPKKTLINPPRRKIYLNKPKI